MVPNNGRQPNVLIIVIDALRPDYLGCYGFNHNVSPNIDSIASDGLLFLNSYSPVYGTDPAVTTLLTGLYPHKHGIVRHGPWVSNTEVTLFKVRALKYWLPRILSKSGYTTIAFDWLGRWHKSYFQHYVSTAESNLEYKWRMIYRKIYRIFPYRLSKIIPGNICPYKKANSVVDNVIKTLRNLRKTNKKFFMLVHFWDTHAPYDPPLKYIKMFEGTIRTPYNVKIQELLRRISNEEWLKYVKICSKGAEYTDDVVARYVASIKFVDDSIGRIIKELKELGMYDNTLIVVVSDHGESFGEHNAYFDHHTLFNEILRNVMIMKLPNSEIKSKKIQSRVTLADVAPTVLDVVGVKRESASKLDGYSLISMLDNLDEVLANREIYFGMVADGSRIDVRIGVIKESWKYTKSLTPAMSKVCVRCGVKHHDEEELFNIEHDAKEENNLVNDANYADIREALKHKLLKELSKHPVIKEFMRSVGNT